MCSTANTCYLGVMLMSLPSVLQFLEVQLWSVKLTALLARAWVKWMHFEHCNFNEVTSSYCPNSGQFRTTAFNVNCYIILRNPRHHSNVKNWQIPSGSFLTAGRQNQLVGLLLPVLDWLSLGLSYYSVKTTEIQIKTSATKVTFALSSV